VTDNHQNFFQLDDSGRHVLLNQWLALTKPYGAAESLRVRAFHELLRHYDGRGRHYHNSSHLAALLRWVARHEGELQQPAALRLAVWFHDVIYRSRRQDNETKSAVYAAGMMRKLGVPEVLSDDVQTMICATQKHTTEPFAAQMKGPANDLCWFLDFDLAILGSQTEIYAAYAKAIRREYAWVPAFLYRKGRRQVLTNFQARPQLFFTATMRAQLEQQARLNMAHELAELA
jgi:predicted metal-dependent HD superfamily phosphohydrolase